MDNLTNEPSKEPISAPLLCTCSITYAPSKPFAPLLGKMLTQVVFVMDYVRLNFDDAYLDAWTLPSVVVEQQRYHPGDREWRNMLCERMMRNLAGSSVVEGEAIRLFFSDGSEITISLQPADYRCVEAAVFNDGEDGLWVW